jgi:acetate kinase
VGDFDPFALPVIMKASGQSLKDVLDQLAEHSGLLGLSGVSGDVRDLEKEAAQGNERARLALDVFVAGIRQHLGSMLVELGGADAIVFTGGIGENRAAIRAKVCADLEGLGIVLNPSKNASAKGEMCVSSSESNTQVWIVPTNEELIVARQTGELLRKSGFSA